MLVFSIQWFKSFAIPKKLIIGEIMANDEKYIKESLIVELHTKTDLLYLFSDLQGIQSIEKELKEILIKIFALNGFHISEKTINKYFKVSLKWIANSLKDNTIKTSKQLKFYIEDEILKIIENEEYLRQTFFNNEYKTIKHFLFIEIE